MHTFIISRSDSTDQYQVWKFSLKEKEKFSLVSKKKDTRFNPDYQLAPLGGYLLAWGSQNEAGNYPYQLLEFDPSYDHPLGVPPIQRGEWENSKFWGYRGKYTNNPDEKKQVSLLSMGNFMLFFLASEGRGTYELFNFDPNVRNPNSSDPLPSNYSSQGGFPDILEGHKLYCLGNYVLDRLPDGASYKLWSFDPQNPVPLSIPEVQAGTLQGIDSRHQLVPMGDHFLTWIPGEKTYSLWSFDPMNRDPFKEILANAPLPKDIIQSDSLLSCLPRIHKAEVKNPTPGTLEFMQSKIKHVVYYMLESRSFDNICGWLYEGEDVKINFIGSEAPFDGASFSNFNYQGDKKAFQTKFMDGIPSNDYNLQDQMEDPFHDNSDGLHQMFYKKYPGYAGKAQPDMKGFVQNNSNTDVMRTLTPQQLPVINGLAANYAISDEWFCSVPGGTDINRAFSVAGSGMNTLSTFEGGNLYSNWPQYPRRQSIWKVLNNHGETDWKIYNSVEWHGFPFTYHLFVEGQMPSVDADSKKYIDTFDNFLDKARTGTLPKFSFVEPIWVAPNNTTSYHPKSQLVPSLVPSELQLKKLFDALKEGPNWEETLFVITFSKNGGIYDHVKPPYAVKPWPNDGVDGFEFDLMGPRVPTIMVSPYIKKNTVFRASGDIPYDSTSFAATLLKWYGIPKSSWGLGDRMDQAPTFENIFQEPNPRKDSPKINIPFDKSFPKS
ncbi:alkaline phosphatase family protein [Algoriphagus namhaensis]